MDSINYEISAPVFNIQTYCIHDGPGIRDTVFVKGCPLRCKWCANPESNTFTPELMTYSSKCRGCGRCIERCPTGAISIAQDELGRFIAVTDRNKCTNCGSCTVCPYQAREIAGKLTTVREAIDKVKQDKIFFESSGGGMTISGGEALAHPDFVENLFAAAHAEGIKTAIETSSYANKSVVDRVFKHVDMALLDIKHMNSAKHKEYTGVPNEQILDNIRHIRKDLNIPVIIRVPTIPGYNDDEENIRAVAAFAAEDGPEVSVNLLPYHRLGESKSESLGRKQTLGIDPPSKEHMESLKAIIESYGVRCKIGG